MIPKIWFTADTHFGHRLMSQLRDFESVEAHDETIISNWNNQVDLNDTVFHLGDFALCHPKKIANYVNRLNGKIHLVTGNHDQMSRNPDVAKLFVWTKELHTLAYTGDFNLTRKHRTNGKKSKKTMIVLCHYPLAVWASKHYGSLHLHGHSHGMYRGKHPAERRMDVGIDACGYSPISLESIVDYMQGLRQRIWL